MYIHYNDYYPSQLNVRVILSDNIISFVPDITCQVKEMHNHLSVAGLSTANKTVKSGHTIWFQCNSPYILDGSEAIECLQSGEWSAPFPTCTNMFTLINS